MANATGQNPVLVVGAGPVGLTMAIELYRRGIACRIVDKSPGPAEQSRAFGIHARTLELFESMGLINDILEAGQKVHVLNVYVHKKRLLHITLDELESPYPYVLALPQAKTEQILIAHLEKLGGKVERQVELVGVAQEQESAKATLKFPDGSGKEVLTPWLVACDGAHSTVRHLLNMGFDGSQYPEAFLLADVTAQTSLSESEAHIFNEDNGFLAVFPFGKGRVRLIADVPFDSPYIQPMENDLQSAVAKAKRPNSGKERVTIDERGAGSLKTALKRRDPTLAEFQEIVDARGPKGLKLLDSNWLATFSIQRRSVKHYRKGRIFLAGDAAHIHSPAGGQGMNTGIQDAYNLAWKLELVIKGVASEPLLDTYEEERHAVAKGVLKMTDFLTRVNLLRNPVARSIRSRLAPFLVAQEVIQQRMRKNVSELAVNYRKSPIVSEHKVGLIHGRVPGHSREELPEFTEWFNFEHGPEPGDRAPDANLFDHNAAKQIRLFEALRGNGHHLLLMAGVRATKQGLQNSVKIGDHIIERYSNWIKVLLISEEENVWSNAPPGSWQLSDPELSLHHRYGAASECLYLIRPDGYVGFRSLPADLAKLKEYLNRIFVE